MGGLADTVQDYQPRKKATGFAFWEYRPDALLEALTRALAAFRDIKTWRAIQTAGMEQDFSWDRSAAEYVKIYDRTIKHGARG